MKDGPWSPARQFTLLLPPPETGKDQIVFTGLRSGTIQIYVMNADGTGVTQLTDESADCSLATASPDGQYIYFNTNKCRLPRSTATAAAKSIWIIRKRS